MNEDDQAFVALLSAALLVFSGDSDQRAQEQAKKAVDGASALLAELKSRGVSPPH